LIRTVNEEKCYDCGVITNAYSGDMGRLCPYCIAKRMAEFGKSLENWRNGVWDYSLSHPLNESEIREICADKTLFNEPLIEHSNDIDKKHQELSGYLSSPREGIKKRKEATQK